MQVSLLYYSRAESSSKLSPPPSTVRLDLVIYRSATPAVVLSSPPKASDIPPLSLVRYDRFSLNNLLFCPIFVEFPVVVPSFIYGRTNTSTSHLDLIEIETKLLGSSVAPFIADIDYDVECVPDILKQVYLVLSNL
jgi:hypothetical protein